MWPFNTKIEVPDVKNNFEIKNETLSPAVALNYKYGDILIFEHPTKLNDEGFERLKTQLEKVFALKENVKSIIILENGMKLATVLNK